VGASICPIQKVFFFAYLSLRHHQRVVSRPVSEIINGNPEAIRVKCLAQDHIGRFFTLSALEFKLATFQLLAQHSNR
jgi:hypothetical protein